MHPSSRSANDFLAEGTRLIFVDDSGSTGRELPSGQQLATGKRPSDFQCFAGIKLKRDCYRDVCVRMSSKLVEIGCGIQEFHATEIVNPKVDSSWRLVDRVAAIEFLSDILRDACELIYYCFINGDQFPQLLQRAQRILPELSPTPKEALWSVFIRGLIQAEVASDLAPIRIIVDSEKLLNDGQIVVQDFHESLGIDGAVIFEDSKAAFGLQLADFVAYVINRSFYIADRITKNSFNPLDKAVLTAYSGLRSRITNLLGEGETMDVSFN